MNDLAIVPAILATREEEFKEEIRRVVECEDLKGGWIQVDIADGVFVASKTIDLNLVQNPADLNIEVHLMVVDPINWLEKVKESGAKRVIIHFEGQDLNKAVGRAKDLGLEVGIALNPETEVKSLEEYVLTIDVIQIMSVHPGFQGQDFLPNSLERIKEASHFKLRNDKLIVEVDGGIGPENIKSVVDSGADILVVGSKLIYGDISENLETLWEAVYR